MIFTDSDWINKNSITMIVRLMIKPEAHRNIYFFIWFSNLSYIFYMKSQTYIYMLDKLKLKFQPISDIINLYCYLKNLFLL